MRNQPQGSNSMSTRFLPTRKTEPSRSRVAGAPAPGGLDRSRVPRRTAGFTVVELVTAVAVLAIVTALAIPSLTNLILDTGLKTAAIDVYNTMVYARSEAIKRNATVDIIPTGGNWKNGWTVQVGATVLKTVGPSTTRMD